MITRDFAGGAAAMLIGAVYLYHAYQIRVSALDDTLGSGGMPRAYGWLLVGLGVVLCLQAAVARARRAPQGEWRGQGRRVLWAAGLLAFGIAYLFVVETLGYLLSIALLLIGVALYQGAPVSGRLVLVGIGGALFLWSLFAVVLGVSMPRGPLAALGL
jgi:putative tricarboxylic transport membrane protein